jgi:hypothetical protein
LGSGLSALDASAQSSRLSVITQLLSAVLYVPALLGVVSDARSGRVPALRWGADLLIVGAMGSAADAVLHLLAFAMTAPGVPRAPMIPVMAFMQGPGLFLLAPLVLSFFLGGAVLSFAFGGAGVISRWNARLHVIGLAVAVIGGGLASSGLVPARLVGLTFLAIVSAAQAWVGLALWLTP